MHTCTLFRYVFREINEIRYFNVLINHTVARALVPLLLWMKIDCARGLCSAVRMRVRLAPFSASETTANANLFLCISDFREAHQAGRKFPIEIAKKTMSIVARVFVAQPRGAKTRRDCIRRSKSRVPSINTQFVWPGDRARSINRFAVGKRCETSSRVQSKCLRQIVAPHSNRWSVGIRAGPACVQPTTTTNGNNNYLTSEQSATESTDCSNVYV